MSTVEEYTQKLLDREGTFRAFPVAWTIVEKESGAAAIRFQFAIINEWGGSVENGWSPNWPPGYYTYNDSWIVGRTDKGGDLNQKTIQRLADCKLWNGDFDALEGPVPSVLVLIDVSANEHEGKTTYRADWVNPDAEAPASRGGFAPADPKVLSTMRSRFGSKTRAIAGGNPNTAAPAPPPTPGVAPQAAAPAAPGAPAGQPTPAAQPTPAVQPTSAAQPAPAAQPVPDAPAAPPTPGDAETATPAAPPGTFIPPALGGPADPEDPGKPPF